MRDDEIQARDLILEHVKANPGARLHDVVEATGCQCGRPRPDAIGAALRHLLLQGALDLSPDRRLALSKPAGLQ